MSTNPPATRPVVIGQGSAVHLLAGDRVLCTSNPRGKVAEVPHETPSCKRCLAKAEKATPAPAAPAPAASSTKAKRDTKKTPALCACGCELPTGGRYRPGHDARHSGWLARQVLAGEMTYDEAMDRLATDALRAKTHRQIERAAAKAAAA